MARSRLRMVGHFGHGGAMAPEQASIRAEFADEGVVFTGREAKQQITHTYEGADVLLFAKEGAGFVTSGKVYEYVATGKPVVSVLDREHDARRVLDGYPRWHDAEASTVPALASAMVEAAEDARHGIHRRAAALEHGARYRRDTLLSLALDRLESELAA